MPSIYTTWHIKFEESWHTGSSFEIHCMTANVGKNNIWQYAKFKHLAKFNLANAHYQLIAFVHKIETQLGTKENMFNLAEPSFFNLVQKFPPP